MATMGFWSWAQQQPERLGLVTADQHRYSYGELLARVNRLSHGLRAQGLERGDLVAVLLPNDAAWVETYLAVHQIGLYMTAINYHLTGPEVAYILENAEAKLFIAHERYAQAAQTAVAQLDFPAQRCFSVGRSRFRPYEDLLAGQAESMPAEREAGQLMLYTSGTTGRPKGVRRPLPGGPPEAAAMAGACWPPCSTSSRARVRIWRKGRSIMPRPAPSAWVLCIWVRPWC